MSSHKQLAMALAVAAAAAAAGAAGAVYYQSKLAIKKAEEEATENKKAPAVKEVIIKERIPVAYGVYPYGYPYDYPVYTGPYAQNYRYSGFASHHRGGGGGGRGGHHH